MLVTLFPIVTLVRPLQPKKAQKLILVTLSGIIKSFTNTPFTYKSWAYLNGVAKGSPKLIAHHFAISEMCTLVKPLQSEKAESPMLVTLSGIVILVKPLQQEKAD